MNIRSIQQSHFFTAILLAVLCLTGMAQAQTTAFTYQGKLTVAGNLASGNYDLQFKLFDTVTVGTGAQQGATLVRNPVAASAGVFTVTLDFGANVFDGAARYLEIGVRPAGDTDAYTVLSPRQPINSTPYATRSANTGISDALSAACIACVTNGQIETVDGAKITGAIPTESVPSGSGNYIQNATALLSQGKRGAQPAASFDIGGDGAVGGNLTVIGQVGVGTATPGPGLQLDVVGNTRMTTANGTVNFGSPSAETGMSVITPQLRADLRLNNSALKLVAGAAGFVPPGTNGLAIDTAGNVGIGTETPGGGNKLDVVGNTRMTTANGTINFGSPSAETGMTIITPQIRADLRLNNSALKLVAGAAGGPAPATNGIAINALGNVGIGTEFPATKLTVDVGSSAPVDAGIKIQGSTSAFGDLGLRIHNTGAGGREWYLDSTNNASGYGGGKLAFVNGLSTFPIMTLTDAGNVGIGTVNPTAKFQVAGTTKTGVLEITGGSDLAEHFAVTEEVKPGLVVAIDPRQAGKLTLARGAYNRRVAGIVSGANNLPAGMVLPDASGVQQSMPVALSGRVWVYCDATKLSIQPGDLLTTAATPGHAMKVTNYARGQGAVIGKAMTGLKSGKGLVLVLVSLQ